MHALSNSLRNGMRRFRRSERGNVMITFALALIPMIGFVGAAVDYSRANSAKAAMQAAVDSTALMLSRNATGLTSAQMSTKALDYFKALIHRPELTNIAVTPTYSMPTAGSFKLVVVATGTMPTSFMKVMGQTQLNIDVSSQVVWGMKKLEIALALDNTLSMESSGKMTALKTAAKNLLATLKKAEKTPGDIKVSIIPFNTVVKLDTSYGSNSWFNWSQISKSNWKGCLEDRDQPNDTNDSAPTSSSTYFPAVPCDTGYFSSGVLTSILPLTSDWTKLNSKVDAMTPDGTTNITIGLVWAWHSLTTSAPLSEGTVPNPDIDKVIILMTDGQNTQNRWSTFSPSTIDARTELVCANIKAAKIKLYTIRVLDGNATLLKNCATNPNMYFNVEVASELNSVFSAIAQNLSNLYIAK